jgi:uncharacterized membrane protein
MIIVHNFLSMLFKKNREGIILLEPLSFLVGIANLIFGGVAILSAVGLWSLRKSILCGYEKLGSGLALAISLVILIIINTKF